MHTLRLIVDPPLTGPENMARDDALLNLVGVADSPPTLRFYRWDPATISLGYFQPYADYAALPVPAGGLSVVRRITGGGAILHDLEVTYSIALPAGHEWLRPNPNRLYELMHDVVINAIGSMAVKYGEWGRRTGAAAPMACGESAQRGPFFCFVRRHALDVVVVSLDSPDTCEKIAGSAQRRTRLAVLQHGSIILDSRYPQQPCATWRSLGGPADAETAIGRLCSAAGEVLHSTLEPGTWSDEERTRSAVVRTQYAGDAWTRRR
ncbi:MAG: lipoate--protein ligase family protein [Phycisphaerae bacterium]|nr:hypothetical protein [Phycisphaerae bacterium]NUQ44904.1 lipoate--protein ligase family protein [Phycisphaerae bacterium]